MGIKSKIVLASGVFDLIHYGHIRFLEEAKKAGGVDAKLVVIVARDRTVKKLKGKTPILPEEERRLIVETLKPVDAAFLGNQPLNVKDILYECKPDIIAFGHDQDEIKHKVEKYIKEHSLPIETLKIDKFGIEDINSSSKIKSLVIKQLKKQK